MADINRLIFDELIDSGRMGVNNEDSWRYKVLMAIADSGDAGATDNELADLLQPPGGQNNIRPRRGELKEKGFVRDTGHKRPTRSGSLATVWRLSQQDEKPLTPAFTVDDCVLAGDMTAPASGSGLTPADRKAGERLRARFALVGRRARRASAELDIPVEVNVQRPGLFRLTVRRAESDQNRFQVTATLDQDGLHLEARIGAADSGDPEADARTEKFRAELGSLPADLTAPIQDLVDEGWQLSTTSAASGELTFDALPAWFKKLVDEPTATATISRTLDPAAVEQAGPSVAGELTQLIQRALPLDAATETAMHDPVQALVNGLLWDEERARDLIALTGRAKQLLFAGPPGTGKTLAARILAAALSDEGRIKLVQFHPTYAYEDFVEGIRPVIHEKIATNDDGDHAAASQVAPAGLRYEIRDGVFKQIVKDARESSPGAPHFLIIDEINRANLPRVLGELLFALEYRGEANKVELAYSGAEFHVPENLWVIGTMNTADRSVALLDAAMRRRFKEVRFDVDYAALRRWHDRHTSADLGTEAAARLERLNAEVVDLLDDDRAIGHSFLIRGDLADIGFEVVWNEDLEPVLRDHLLGRTDDLPSLREAFLGEV